MKRRPDLPWAGRPFPSPMTSDNNFSLILRRLDEIERNLDRMMEELRTPTAVGYSVRRNLPRRTDGLEEQIFGVSEQVRERGQSD